MSSERQYRDEFISEQSKEKGPIAKYEEYLYGGGVTEAEPQSRFGSGLTPEQLEAQSAHLYQELPENQSTTEDKEQSALAVDLSSIQEKAGNMGLKVEVLGQSVKELSKELSDLSNPSSESTTWWQSLLQNVPYLGGLVEPDSGRMLLNLGDEGYVLLTGDIQSLDEMIVMLSQLAPGTSFWNFPLLVGINPSVVREAEDIMIGSRSSDLSDFIDAARNGSVDINGVETEAVQLLRWMALQAGEQSTDIEENENATESDLVFAAAMSDRTIFVDPYSDGTADRLVDSIRGIYELVETAPVAEQRNLEEMLEDELLNIISEDNRWGITDNDLERMVEEIQDLEQQLQQNIESLLAQEAEATETANTESN